jgi:hypothetical protein
MTKNEPIMYMIKANTNKKESIMFVIKANTYKNESITNVIETITIILEFYLSKALNDQKMNFKILTFFFANNSLFYMRKSK